MTFQNSPVAFFLVIFSHLFFFSLCSAAGYSRKFPSRYLLTTLEGLAHEGTFILLVSVVLQSGTSGRALLEVAGQRHSAFPSVLSTTMCRMVSHVLGCSMQRAGKPWGWVLVLSVSPLNTGAGNSAQRTSALTLEQRKRKDRERGILSQCADFELLVTTPGVVKGNSMIRP